MVAPYEVGDPARSFVKVPGSGTNSIAKALVCDLSPVSTVAAATTVPVLVREHRPSATASVQDVARENLENPSKTADSGKGTRPEIQDEEGNSEKEKPRKRQREDEESDGIPSSPSIKRAREVTGCEMTCQDGKNKNTSSVGIDTAGKRCSSSGAQNAISVGIDTVGKRSASIGTQTDFVTDEMSECHQLREKNKLLERRLAHIRDVFRNKEQLAKLVRALEVKTAC